MLENAGRTCPLAYRYGAAALVKAQPKSADTLYVVGGLYGNPDALAEVEAMAQAEPTPVTLVFNGDFNWFNVDDSSFDHINQTVLRHDAIQGNVEFELYGPNTDSGCGCAYPDTVDQATVDRSNRIHTRLKTTASKHPALLAQLAALPLFARYAIGTLMVGVVHGDADSLAGWTFDAANIDQPEEQAHIARMFEQAQTDIFASSHTCVPVLRRFALGAGRQGVVVNNGAAGMPNFKGIPSGLLTRISVHPSPHLPLYGTRLGGVHIDSLPINYNPQPWRDQFLANWPAGSDAYVSYFSRIENGPDHALSQATTPG
jgi:hypothetical protein